MATKTKLYDAASDLLLLVIQATSGLLTATIKTSKVVAWVAVACACLMGSGVTAGLLWLGWCWIRTTGVP